MKKNVILFSLSFVICTAVCFRTYVFNSSVENDELLIANVEALSVESEGSQEEVKCYCKTNWFSPNVCSVNASGGYCGGDPCSKHDGNCR